MTAAELREKLEKMIEIRVSATKGKVFGHYTKPISEVRAQVVTSVEQSIQKSIEHDGGHGWCWLEDENESIIVQTGCGPTSEANMTFIGHAFADYEQVLRSLIEAVEALEEIRARNEIGGLVWARTYMADLASNALAAIGERILNPK